MKKLIAFSLFTCLSIVAAFSQTEFELLPPQSMLMTGKGPGQDATINPYDGKDCYAIVENIGENEFYIRIQKNGVVIQTITISKNERKKFKLLKSQELYLDPNENGLAKARVSYEELRG